MVTCALCDAECCMLMDAVALCCMYVFTVSLLQVLIAFDLVVGPFDAVALMDGQ